MNIKALAALILILSCASCATLRPAPSAPPAPYMGDNYQLILIAACGHERDSST